MSSSLTLEHVSVKYRDFSALVDVSIEVREGSITTVLGANGAGKSTLMHAISGLQRIHAGTITLDSRRIDRMSRHRITRSGVVQVPEARGIFPDMTVEENLMLAACYRSRSWLSGPKARAALKVAYEQFPVLETRKASLAATLSGGQQQMLSLARSFLLRPKVLLADELSFGLAPALTDTVFRHVEMLNKTEGITLLMVEQNVGRALDMASFVYILRTGTIVFEGPPEKLRENRDLLFSYMVG